MKVRRHMFSSRSFHFPHWSFLLLWLRCPWLGISTFRSGRLIRNVGLYGKSGNRFAVPFSVYIPSRHVLRGGNASMEPITGNAHAAAATLSLKCSKVNPKRQALCLSSPPWSVSCCVSKDSLSIGSKGAHAISKDQCNVGPAS